MCLFRIFSQRSPLSESLDSSVKNFARNVCARFYRKWHALRQSVNISGHNLGSISSWSSGRIAPAAISGRNVCERNEREVELALKESTYRRVLSPGSSFTFVQTSPISSHFINTHVVKKFTVILSVIYISSLRWSISGFSI